MQQILISQRQNQNMQNTSDKLPGNFCYYAMQGFSSHPHGRTRPCCFSRQNTKRFMSTVDVKKYPVYDQESHRFEPVNNIEDFVNDDEIKKIRKSLINGEKPKGCSECFKLEDQGVRSFRQTFNEIYEDEIDTSLKHLSEDGHLDPKAITYLDISLGNVCNLKCRSCNPWASSRWIEEGPTVPHTDWDETAYIVGNMSSKNPWFIHAFETGFFDGVLPNVKRINFIGGEPLVVKEHYAWLEHIVDCGWADKIDLHYNTNATTIPDKLLDIWKHFKGVVLSISIDAVGDLAYYVRFPSKWSVVQKQVNKLKNFSKNHTGVTVQTHVTLSVLNLHDLPNVLDWCEQNYRSWHYTWEWGNHGYQNCLPHFNFVDWPQNMNIRHLPDQEKTVLAEMLDQQYNKFSAMQLPEWEQHSVENIKGIKNILLQQRDPEMWSQFIDNTRASDNFRDINILDYIPWMEKYI